MDVEMSGWDEALIAKWGEHLYYRPVQSRPSKRGVSGLLVAVANMNRHASVNARANRIRIVAGLTANKTPEVMVKISGSGKGMNKIRAHFEYISRNGKVELENENGELINGREAVRDLGDEWKSGLYGIPDEGTKRESFNIVLSMPPGTDRATVTRAARDFAQSEFSANHQFVFATHDDERHPHLHLCVKVLGNDTTRLNPRKADLQRWREGFAERLRAYGIEANATPRFARGITRSAKRQQDIHRTIRDGGQGRETKSRSTHALELLRASLKAYEGLARALAPSPSSQDRRLAVEVVRFVNKLPGIDADFEKTRSPPQRQNEKGDHCSVTRVHVDPGPER
jgi:hypothetical protein